MQVIGLKCDQKVPLKVIKCKMKHKSPPVCRVTLRILLMQLQGRDSLLKWGLVWVLGSCEFLTLLSRLSLLFSRCVPLHATVKSPSGNTPGVERVSGDSLRVYRLGVLLTLLPGALLGSGEGRR